MSSIATPGERFALISGNLCLDFANTVGGIRGGIAHERLNRFTDLVLWSQQAGVLSENEARDLLDEAKSSPAEAAVVFERAFNLRETIYRIFSAIAHKQSISDKLLAPLNTEFVQAMTHMRLTDGEHGFELGWSKNTNALDQMLWPITRSAVDLLTSPDLKKVKECASESCGWLFVDTTKNSSRQWCETQGCGNKARVRKHRQRRRSGLSSPNQ
jgi:predicted RNA-binding Zn ribbon-like protein